MAYAAIADVKNVLRDAHFSYPSDISAQLDYAEAQVNSKLGGRYALPFDDTSLYTSVPVQIKWITSYLVAYKLWDEVTLIEGQQNDTAAQRWLQHAMEWLDRIASGDERLTYSDGSLVDLPAGASGAPRFYPSGIRDKADSEDNEPYFTRAQAHEW